MPVLSIATFTVTNAPSSATTDTPALLPTDEANLPPVQEADATGAADSETISSTQTETPAYFQVYLKNDCDKTAQFAIHYKNLDDAWVTDGWWELRPGEFSYVADTTNKILYYYGERLEGGNPWWGTDLSLNVNGSTQFYGFKEYTTTNTDWGKWIISFTCPSGT